MRALMVLGAALLIVLYQIGAAPDAPAQIAPVAPDLALAPAGDMESIVFAAADHYGVPRNLARAVLSQESGGDPGSTSAVGAAGLMQVMPGTAAGIASELGVASYDIYDPQTNAQFGMYYLSEKITRYGVPWGLAAYNWGPGGVDSFLERHPGIDWDAAMACCAGEIPSETQHYVANILAMADQSAPQTAPAVAPADPAGAVASAPISLAGDCGRNVQVALDANGGALRNVRINPGETFSFNATMGNPGAIPSVSCAGVDGGNWCNLAARYAQVARALGLTPQFDDHGVGDMGAGPENSVLIWNVNGQAGSGGESHDLEITNTFSRPIVFVASDDGASVTIEGVF